MTKDYASKLKPKKKKENSARKSSYFKPIEEEDDTLLVEEREADAVFDSDNDTSEAILTVDEYNRKTESICKIPMTTEKSPFGP